MGGDEAMVSLVRKVATVLAVISIGAVAAAEGPPAQAAGLFDYVGGLVHAMR